MPIGLVEVKISKSMFTAIYGVDPNTEEIFLVAYTKPTAGLREHDEPVRVLDPSTIEEVLKKYHNK